MRFRIKTIVAFLFVLPVCFSGCNPSPHATRGFRLPEGNIDKGRALFNELQCLACHQVAGSTTNAIKLEMEIPIPLGGEVAIAKTYAEILTSIINPSHRISQNLPPDIAQHNGESTMRNYNDIISVTELIDLVTYVETLYELKAPEATQN